jgi:UDP-N-acetylglucosamine 2-epimerase
LSSNVITIDPVGYKQFLTLLNYSILVMTDSGGVQEESAVLKKRCITLRKSTERQETLLVKANRLFYPFGDDDDDFQLDNINNIIEEMLVEKQFVNPYGEDVTIKTVKTIEKIIENNIKNYLTIKKN